MKCLSLPSSLLLISSFSILIALCLAGASLAKSVKWNFYNYELDYGYGITWYMHAYQTLWTSYDAWTGNSDLTHMQVFKPLKDDSWRLLPRLLIMSTLGLGALSLCVLIPGSLVPMLKTKTLFLNGCRIASSVISVCAGSLLVYTLTYFDEHYQSILTDIFDDKTSGYPEKDNKSTGFYIAAVACTFYFISASVNIANVVILIKTSTATVNPKIVGQKGTSNKAQNNITITELPNVTA
ncbi:Hypothetical predicted protein [Mytilus galloprovincialis]|uniref:Uncharacterized protein n=1 Tax=Mytilus galloprovincialis TaxID=29158 RepID=A0A8B6CXJ1_MYTGA|nr:Hypothetical predicted protein [Mytilus galloprovincialis]